MESESNGTSQSLESGVVSAVHRVQGNLQEQYQAYEESVKKSPGSSLLIAAAVGYVFRTLPVGALLGGIIRLVFALVRPALFLYVAAKGYEYLQGRVSSGQQGKAAPTNVRRAPRAPRG